MATDSEDPIEKACSISPADKEVAMTMQVLVAHAAGLSFDEVMENAESVSKLVKPISDACPAWDAEAAYRRLEAYRDVLARIWAEYERQGGAKN